MAHKRKKRRTQQSGQTNNNAVANGVNKTNPADRTPKSMVIRMGAGEVGSSVTQLVKDVRSVMEPHTASRLRERRANKLRDFTTMAGPLGVTHFLLFYRAPSGNTNLKVAIPPHGPTLSFHVEKYSLSKDVAKSQRHPKVGAAGMDHLQPPLLVMNNFTTGSTDPKTQQTKTPIPKHLETLTTTTFQSLFPPISPQRTPLSTIRRVLLVNREIPAFPQPLDPSSVSENGGKESQPYILNFRHYAITTKPLLPLSRGIKRLHSASQHANTRSHKPQSRDYPISPPPNTNPGSNADSDAPAQTTSAPKNLKSSRARKGGLPDLSHLPDVADYILPAAEGGCGRGWTSASESEADLTEAEVEVLEGRVKRVWGRKEREERRQAALEAQQQSAPDPANGDGEANPGDQENGEQKPRKRALPRTQKHALKLTELGPRMRLRLYKVEEGLCGGKVLWHESVEKTREEEREMDRVWEGRRREREARRRVQRENVERKRKEKEERSGKTKEGGNLDSKQQNQKQEEDESEGETDEEAWDDVMDEEMEDEDGGEVDEDGEMEVDE